MAISLGSVIDAFLSQQGGGVDPFAQINQQLAILHMAITAEIKAMSDTLSTEITSLTADVAALKDAEQKATLMISGLAGKLSDALAAAQSAGATTQQLQALNDLHTNLQNETQALAAAVAAQEPAPAPAPEPTPTPAPEPAPAPAPAPEPAPTPTPV